MVKKIICLMLAILMTIGLCACQSGSKQADANKGGTNAPAGTNTSGAAAADGTVMLYDEKEIGSDSTLQNPIASRINSKKQLVVLDQGDGRNIRFVTLDKEGKPVGEVKCSIIGYIEGFDLDSHDRMVLMVSETNKEKEEIQKLEVIDSTGAIVNTFEVNKYKIGGSYGKIPVAMDIALDRSDSVYVATLNGIIVLDKSGKQIKKIGTGDFYSIDITGEGKIVAIRMAAGKNEVVMIDPATGDSVWTADIPIRLAGRVTTSDSISAMRLRFDSSSGSICYMNEGGIIRYDNAGKPLGMVLDFSRYMIMASGNTPAYLSIDEKGDFFILTKGKSEFEILRYDIANGMHRAKSRKVLTLAIPTIPKWLSVAASKFQKVNQDYRVELKEYGQSGSDKTAAQAAGTGNESYVRTINTELLSRKGPDIILVNGLPYAKYVSRGILADLTGYMRRDGGFDNRSYFMNILNAMKLNGRQYVLPASVSFELIAANKALLDQKSVIIDDSKWNWNDFRQIGEKLVGKDNGKSAGIRLLPEISSGTLLDSMLRGYYSSFVDENTKKAGFDSKAFINLLNIARTYGTNNNSGVNTVSKGNNFDPEAAERGTLVFSMQSFTDYNDYAFLGGLYKDKLKLLHYPSVGESKGGVFNSDSVFAINNHSANKDAAWAFLKFLLSDEVQSDEIGGFAIRKDSLKKMAASDIEMTNSGSMVYAISKKGSDKPLVFKPKKLTQSDIEYLNGFMENMKVYNNSNDEIKNIVLNEAVGFFSGSKSAEDTANVIQQKAGIYLGE